MKNSIFTLLKADEKQVRKIIVKFLKEHGYDPIITSDYILGIGDVPVMLLAHYDTVHAHTPHHVTNTNGILTSPNTGLGADDRAGVFGVLEVVKNCKCHVLFCGGEEIGCVGSGRFADDYIKGAIPMLDVNYCIQLDRRGKNDAVYYEGDNKEFEEFISGFGWETASGSFTDICKVCPALDVSGVNLSIGYEHEHHLDESLDMAVMNANIERVKGMLGGDLYKWVERKYEYASWYRGTYHGSLGREWYEDYYDAGFDDGYNCGVQEATAHCYRDKRWVVEFLDPKDEEHEQVEISYGVDEYDAIGTFLMAHPSLCFNDIIDFFPEDDGDDIDYKQVKSH